MSKPIGDDSILCKEYIHLPTYNNLTLIYITISIYNHYQFVLEVGINVM